MFSKSKTDFVGGRRKEEGGRRKEGVFLNTETPEKKPTKTPKHIFVSKQIPEGVFLKTKTLKKIPQKQRE